MDNEDRVNLIRGGVPAPGGVWADLGSGTGAFTLALADLIGPAGKIYSVDKDKGALAEQERVARAQFPNMAFHYQAVDFTRRLNLPLLDGVVMANALHFQRRKEDVLRLVRGYLKPVGRLILVEYNIDWGSPWVPYPIPYKAWEVLAGRIGFTETRLLARVPSRFHREIYSAVSW
jgi:ubiquinone/menaquinone biosynthesis C-methylase UbiE